MNEPSKEAIEMAHLALRCDSGDWQGRVAAALQELMDQRDAAREDRDAADGCSRLLRDRTEAAERKLAELVRRAREWNRVHNGTAVRWPGLESILNEYGAKP